MSIEALAYRIQRETRRGPFGIVRQQEQVGQLLEGGLFRLPLATSQVELGLKPHSRVLTIRTQGEPVTVECGAEPQRFKPKVVVRLSQEQPEISTGRRKVSIYPMSDPSQRLVLEAPRFQPLILSGEQTVRLITGSVIGNHRNTLQEMETRHKQELEAQRRALIPEETDVKKLEDSVPTES